MIIKDKTDSNIERHKQHLGLTGDVYLVDGIFMESLESHKVLIPESKATTIEEAYEERIAFEEERKKRIQEEVNDGETE